METPINNWRFEKQSAYLYRILARKEKDPKRSHLFARLAEEAEKQAAIWEGQLTAGIAKTVFIPSFRTRFTGWLIGLTGPRAIKGILSAMKVRGMSVYQAPLTHDMPEQLSQVGMRHKNLGAGDWLRASVFGANDGLVSNASLILGVAGASLDSQVILLTGAAGLLAGAFSMACGEYVSVRSQREFFEKQIAVEKEELDNYPEEEAAELALIFEARGLPLAQAQTHAKTLISDPEKALETLAREELGVDPGSLGSPLLAAASSFISFVFGAFIPLIPFLFRTMQTPVLFSIAISFMALLGIGAVLSLFTGRSMVWGALRMAMIGSAAGTATFGVGRLLGVSAP